MATPQDDDLDKKALMDQLDPTRGSGAPTSTTMPVPDPTKPAQLPAEAAAPATPARTPTQASVFQGFTPKYAMEGFDFNREQNTGKSAKDAFAYLSQQAPPPPINDKAALGKWAEQYIVPGMKDLGHDVSNVQGDKFHLKNWQGDFDVDYGRGAGAEGGALAWQVDDPTAKLSNAAYTPKANPAMNPALMAAISGGQQGTSPQDQLQQQVAALAAGETAPMDQEALLKQLQA
jgi:hypothetical protein